MLPKIAVLDLGSNSFHLAVAECLSNRRFVLAAHAKEKVQLGQSVFENGVVDEAGAERARGALRRLRALCDRERPTHAIGVATSALREAQNGAAFVREAAVLTGIPIRVISGEEEARLVCLGTLRELPGTRDPRSRVAIFDLGGGSTEVIVADARSRALTRSLKLGTLRMRAAIEGDGKPRASALAQLELAALSVLAPSLARVSRLGVEEAVLSCGSARKLVRLARRLGIDDCGTVDAPVLAHDTLCELQARLAGLAPAARAALVGSDPRRADTLLVAATIFKPLFARLDLAEARVSLTGLREGVIADKLASLESAAQSSYAVAL
ncbi:MAG: hypothetical protein ABW252_16675 [Polyangiales bacterium]